MEIIKPGTKIDFIGVRYYGYVFSGLLILIGILSLVVKGPKFGIDFAGGTLIQIKSAQTVTIDKIEKGLGEVGLAGSAVQQMGAASENQFLIRAKAPAETEKGFTDRLKKVLATATGSEVDIQRIEMVGPQVGKDLRAKALYAMFYSLLFIALYISGRFELKWVSSAILALVLIGSVYFFSMFNVSISLLIIFALLVTLLLFWQLRLKYAMAAIVGLIHDLAITVGFLSMFNYEFTLPVVAALLTLVGYSLTDTIVIFDRIRENLKRHSRMNLPDIINLSVNETLSRTILTSATAWITVICLFFLGGVVTRDFAFAMIIGVFFGTYSSVYVSSPILLFFKDVEPTKTAVTAAA